MFKTFKNAWSTPELKTKLLFTLLIIMIYRLGCSVMVPWISSDAVEYFNSLNAGSIFGFMNLLSGGAFAQATLFALGVSPYITSSIVMQLLTIVIPKLEQWSKEGEEGRKKISAITRIVTIVLAIITSIGYSLYVINAGMTTIDTSKNYAFQVIVMVACYCAGASIVMWMAERVNDHGIGNGISIILFAGIISSLPGGVIGFIGKIYDGRTFNPWWILWCVVIAAILLLAVYFIVWFTNSERRIPVQYAKRVVGRKMYGGQSSNLPLKLNMSGVMPVIFANAIVTIPATIASFANMKGTNKFWNTVVSIFANTKPLYIVLFTILLVAFAYFYIMISFNPIEVANNIKNNGGAIPGIRPGKPTKDYIQKTLNRITFIGAIFLCVISALPMIVNAICVAFGHSEFQSLALSGTSVLIVVGVILETERELESQLTLRNYKGFLD